MKRIGFFGLSLVLGSVFSASADSALVDFERKWVFPQDLGGLKYEISEKFETADFGYRIIYRAADGFEAEVSIYDFGRDAVPNGCKGEGISAVLQSVDDALKLYQSLQSATGAQVQIRRRGQIRTIDYKIEG